MSLRSWSIASLVVFVAALILGSQAIGHLVASGRSDPATLDPALAQSLRLIPLMSFAFGVVASLLLAALFWKSAFVLE